MAVLTPWLNAGETYQIEIFVDNSYNYRRVSVDEVSILAASGPDTNGNGIPEWVETWVRDKNGLDQRLISSRTSPAIVEGRARYTEMAKAESERGQLYNFDGLTNFREFQAGTDPSKANPIHGVSGYAQWEYWENIRPSSRRQTVSVMRRTVEDRWS